MAGRTASAAVKAFREPIERALACFASCQVMANSYKPDVEGILTLNAGEPVKLRKSPGGSRIELEATMRYRIVRHRTKGAPWKVSTTAWSYELHEDDKRIVAFHWHPNTDSRVKTPHVHLEASPLYRKKHVPTGRVLIEDVLAFAHELGASPAKTEWERILQANREKFLLGATWGTMSPADGLT